MKNWDDTKELTIGHNEQFVLPGAVLLFLHQLDMIRKLW
jgi:hypothetical protein